MSLSDFLPVREAALRDWSRNFSQKLSADPGLYGVTAAQAGAYAALNSAFASAFQLANRPTTNSGSNVLRKNIAKKAVVAEARRLSRQIHSAPGVTDVQKFDLGLSVPGAHRRRLPVPDAPPRVRVVRQWDRRVTIELRDRGRDTRRGRPAGVQGAAVFSYVGESPPEGLEGWNFRGMTTRAKMALTLDASLSPGTKVWLTAFWVNPRLQGGPAAMPIETYIEYGGWATKGEDGEEAEGAEATQPGEAGEEAEGVELRRAA